MGCGDNDAGLGIAVDKAGNVYTTGYFLNDFDFDPGPGETILDSAGGKDVFVMKFDAADAFVWVRRIGHIADDTGHALALDASGNVYVAGEFNGTVDFDPGAGTANLISAGGSDAFVCKLNPAGEFVWAIGMGGADADRGRAIAVDGLGNVLSAGSFIGTVDFDPGAGAANLTSADAAADAFVQKVNSSGALIWARALTGAGTDEGRGVAADTSGNVLVTGPFENTTDFDPGAGTANRTSQGDADVFVCKLNASGEFVWAGAAGGAGRDEGVAVAVDSAGNVHTAGSFTGTADFDPGAGAANLTASAQKTFVQKLNSSGSFVWARATGGVAAGVANNSAVTLDKHSGVYLTGSFEGTADFDPGAGTFSLTALGLADIFIQKFDASGNFVWAKQMGGDHSSRRDAGLAVAFDAPSDLWTTGQFYNLADFDPSEHEYPLPSVAQADIYLSRLKVGTWVDFAFAGVEEGSLPLPFDSVSEGTIASLPSMAVLIKGDTAVSTSSETLTLDDPLTIEAINGAVRIGVTQAQGVVPGTKTGFISRR